MESGSVRTLTRYDGQMPVQDAEYGGSGAWQKTTDYAVGARGVDAMSVTTSVGTSVSYPLYDAHGNMISTLSKNGSGYTYGALRVFDAWGRVRLGATTGDPKGRYCASLGHRQDDESGLVYMRARYYEPGTGRFISEDPAMDGANWFSYCGGDPVNKVDFTGKWRHILIGAALGGISAAIAGAANGQEGWRLTASIVAGVIAGALSAATGAWIAAAVEGAGGVLAGGAAGGALGGFINSLTDEIAAGKGINWGRVGRSIGIGGTLGLCFGAVGAAAQRNGEIAAAIAGLNADLWGTATDAYLGAN